MTESPLNDFTASPLEKLKEPMTQMATKDRPLGTCDWHAHQEGNGVHSQTPECYNWNPVATNDRCPNPECGSIHREARTCFEGNAPHIKCRLCADPWHEGPSQPEEVIEVLRDGTLRPMTDGAAADWRQDTKTVIRDEGHEGRSSSPAPRIYAASRASLPERPAMWKSLRAGGVNIVSSWIDEAEPGATADLGELWERIFSEIASADRLVLYVEAGDFPLKGALIEAGIALGLGKPVWIVAPGMNFDAPSYRPIGSWINHPRVKLVKDLKQACISEGAPLPAPQVVGCISSPIDQPSCTFCGTPMEFKCPSCGSTPACTEPLPEPSPLKEKE